MDRQEPFIGQLEDDHLEEVSGGARTDDEQLRRVGVPVQVDDNEGMVGRMEEVVAGDPVAPRRAMYLHTVTS